MRTAIAIAILLINVIYAIISLFFPDISWFYVFLGSSTGAIIHIIVTSLASKRNKHNERGRK